MTGVRASEWKKRAEHFENSTDFSSFLTKFQHLSAHISALLFCAEFFENWVHFLHNFWKFSRPGYELRAESCWSTCLWTWNYRQPLSLVEVNPIPSVTLVKIVIWCWVNTLSPQGMLLDFNIAYCCKTNGSWGKTSNCGSLRKSYIYIHIAGSSPFSVSYASPVTEKRVA